MKLKSILLVLVTFVLSSCSVTDSNSNETGLVGEWNWIESTHGWSGDLVLPDSVGYSQYVIFRSDSTFSHFVADTLMVSGTYSLESEENMTTINYQIEDNGFYPEQRFEYLKDDVIKFVNLCMDCGTSTYERKK